MPYDASKDINNFPGPSGHTFGRKSRAVTPSDTVDLDPYAKGVSCLTDGNIAVIPIEADDADVVAYTGVQAGFEPPFQVRRVMATGTTCTVRTVDV